MKANTPPGQNRIVKSVSLVSQFVVPATENRLSRIYPTKHR